MHQFFAPRVLVTSTSYVLRQSCASLALSAMNSHLQTEQAHKVANAVVFSQLESLIKNNPAIDLSHILNQQVASYPQLVSSLAKTTLPSPPGLRLGNVDVVAEAGSKQDKLPRISSETPIKVIHPISHEILSLLDPELPSDSSIALSDHLPQVVVEALNNLIQEGQILHQLHGTYVISVGLHYAVKTDTSGDLDQITNLQYIHDKFPDIPAPRCLGTIADGQRIYFFMSRPPGSTLESVWPDLSVSTKVSLRNQLNSLFHHIRLLCFESQTERALIGGFVSGVSKDIRRTERIASDPVRSEKEFNEFLCSNPGRTTTMLIKTVCSSMSHNHRIVSTHGDLHPRNIMVDWEKDENGRMLEDTVRVSSILDWEAAGWYPEHWEFVKAMHAIDSRGPLRDWIDYLPTEAIGNYMIEYSVDCLIDRWHG
ncbi:kinase-like domain-containing protein [Nemania serpens]|nr:kinase-like domain-containing protein [Nemania serpens]